MTTKKWHLSICR